MRRAAGRICLAASPTCPLNLLSRGLQDGNCRKVEFQSLLAAGEAAALLRSQLTYQVVLGTKS